MRSLLLVLVAVAVAVATQPLHFRRPRMFTREEGRQMVLEVGGEHEGPTPEPGEDFETPEPGYVPPPFDVFVKIADDEVSFTDVVMDITALQSRASSAEEGLESLSDALEAAVQASGSALQATRSQLSLAVQAETSRASRMESTLATTISSTRTDLQSTATALRSTSAAGDVAVRTELLSRLTVVANDNAAIVVESSRAQAEESKIRAVVNPLVAMQPILATLSAQFACNSDPDYRYVAGACRQIGSHEQAPAPSCRRLKALGKPDGIYWIQYKNGGTETVQVRCDMQTSGGGWELIMSINGNSDTFEYRQSHWTSPTTVGAVGSAANWGTDFKSHGFNYGDYAEIQARWRDPYAGDQWAWGTPPGFLGRPLVYFNTQRTIRTGGSTTSAPEYNGRFSRQDCARGFYIATCTGGNFCSRWGFHWNNECNFGSNDAGGGIGMIRINGNMRAAGDWFGCCGYRGRARDFDVQFWARASR